MKHAPLGIYSSRALRCHIRFKFTTNKIKRNRKRKREGEATCVHWVAEIERCCWSSGFFFSIFFFSRSIFLYFSFYSSTGRHRHRFFLWLFDLFMQIFSTSVSCYCWSISNGFSNALEFTLEKEKNDSCVCGVCVCVCVRVWAAISKRQPR